MDQSFSAGGSDRSLWIGVGLAVLLDAPFFAVFLLSVPGSDLLTLLVLATPLTITALLVWVSYLARGMKYVLDEEDLRVVFPASPLRVPYTAIRSAEKVETSLVLRLFGGSWPGIHWGIFTTKGYGRVRSYSTRYKGVFLLIGLADGSKILLSPEEPEEMLSELRKRVDFSLTVKVEPEVVGASRRFVLGQVAVVTSAWILLLLYVAMIYPSLPPVIPVHWGLNGMPDRYGGKVEVLWLLGVSALFPVLNDILCIKFGKYNKGLMIILGAAFLFAIGIFGGIFWMIASST